MIQTHTHIMHTHKELSHHNPPPNDPKSLKRDPPNMAANGSSPPKKSLNTSNAEWNAKPAPPATHTQNH